MITSAAQNRQQGRRLQAASCHHCHGPSSSPAVGVEWTLSGGFCGEDLGGPTLILEAGLCSWDCRNHMSGFAAKCRPWTGQMALPSPATGPPCPWPHLSWWATLPMWLRGNQRIQCVWSAFPSAWLLVQCRFSYSSLSSTCFPRHSLS